MQNELADALATGYEARVDHLKTDNRAKTEWALAKPSAGTRSKCPRAGRMRALARNRGSDGGRAHALGPDEWRAAGKTGVQLNMIRASRWIKLGRKFEGPLSSAVRTLLTILWRLIKSLPLLILSPVLLLVAHRRDCRTADLSASARKRRHRMNGRATPPPAS